MAREGGSWQFREGFYCEDVGCFVGRDCFDAEGTNERVLLSHVGEWPLVCGFDYCGICRLRMILRATCFLRESRHGTLGSR